MGDIHGQAATDEMQEERELRAAAEQNFHELLIDSLPCTFVVMDLKLRLVRWNRNFQVVSEYSDHELMSMSMLDLVVDESRTTTADGLRWALEGHTVRMNVIGRTRSGRALSTFVVCQQGVVGGHACIMGVGWDATQHRLTELKLANDPNVLSTLIDNLPDAVYIKDRESRFVLCNREVLRRKGVESLSEIAGRSDFDFYPADLAQSVYADEQDLMRTGRPIVNLERCVIDRVTGRPTWNLTTKVPLRNASNETVGLVGIGRDITERKQAEEAYHAIVDHSLQGLVVVQDVKIVFANLAMAKIAGYTIDEMLSASGTQLEEFVHPSDREMVWRNHQIRLGGESLPDQYEFRVIRKDGSVRWLEIITSRIDYQGRPAIQAACVDVTDRHRAQDALRRSEARTMALLNANPDLMFRLTRGGMFLDCKPSKDGAVSVSPAQFVGKHLDEVFPASTARALMQLIQAAVDTGQVQTLEYSLPRTDNGNSDFECRLVACAEQEVVAIVRDISDRRRAEHLAKLQADMAIRLSSLSDLKEGLQYCLEAAVKTSHMDCGGIYVLDEHTGSLNLEAHLGLSPEFVAETCTYPAISRNAQLVMAGQPAYATHDRLGVPVGPAQKAARLRAMGAIPIRHEGRVVACLNVASHTLDEVPPWSRVVLETLAAQIGSAISRLKVQDALQRAEREKAVILNAMGQIVIYHDVSHKIRWANQVALDALKMTVEEITGRRCYDVWEGAAMPCKGCPVDLALRTGCPQESEIVGYNGGTWLVRGEPVRDHTGRLLGVVELAIDITRRKQAEEESRRRLRFEGLVANISADFANLQPEQIEAGVERALAGIGSFVQADRCYVYLFHDGGARMSKVREWCAEGVDRVQGRIWDVGIQGISAGLELLRRTGILSIPSVQGLPDEQAETRELLESISVKSLLCAPMTIGGELFGLLGVSSVREEREWPSDAEPLLKITAEILANALERKRAGDVLRERLAFETLLSELSATFINLPAGQIDGEIERWLARIGELLRVDRATIVQFFGAAQIVTHSWAMPGIGHASPSLAELDFEWTLTRMREDGVFACARIEDIPAAGRREREYYEREGIKSIITMPLKVAGSMLGSVSFSSTQGRRCWSDELVQRLRLVGQVFANAMLRRRAEEALRASENRLRSIVRAVPAGIGLLFDRVMLEVNDKLSEMTGYRREELVNANVRVLYPTQEDYERVGMIYDGIYSRGFGIIETRWRRKDGGTIDVLLHGTPLDLTDRSKGIIFAALDVTERKRAELALQESERQLRTLMANLPGIAYRCANAPGWRFEFVSEGSLTLTGYTPQEVTIGGAISYGSLIHPDDERMVWDTVQDAVRRNASFDMEYRIHTKEGMERWVYERGRAVPCPHSESLVLEGFIMDITERKRAEAALRESESRFRDLADLLPQTVFETDAGGFFAFANRAGLQQFGYSEEEAPTVKLLQTVIPDDRKRAELNMRKRLVGQPVLTNEYTAVRKDGSTFPVLLYSSPIIRDGRPAGFRGIVIDITERHRSEAALRESEKKYRELYEGSRDGFVVSDNACRIVECNSVFLELLGYSKEEIRALTLRDITPSRWLAEEERIGREQLHRRGYSDVYEREYLRKDGSVFPAEVRAYVSKDASGGPCGTWAVVRDITARKQVELALRASEQNYREIFNASNDAIFIHDAVTGDILDVNKTALELFGYGPEEISRLNSEAAGTGEQPYARQNALKWIHKTAEEGPQLFEWSTETKDGVLRWEEVSLRPAVLGGHRRVLAVARDITDRKKAEMQAQEHLTELTRAWHANTLGEMASGLAHELNQPLCAIVNYSNGCLRLFRKKDYPMETVRDSIERIAVQAQRAADIIKRIRRLVAKRDPQRGEVDLEAVLAETIQMLRDEALKHNVAIISRQETGLPKVRGDSVEIGQVVLNLMRNAIEAMSDGRIAHRNLTISSRLSNSEEVEVSVADTGRGISPELSEKVFESFFTTKTQGLGIGLSLSTRIVEAHGGRLWVESDGRSGATFRFTLPVEGATHGER